MLEMKKLVEKMLEYTKLSSFSFLQTIKNNFVFFLPFIHSFHEVNSSTRICNVKLRATQHHKHTEKSKYTELVSEQVSFDGSDYRQ